MRAFEKFLFFCFIVLFLGSSSAIAVSIGGYELVYNRDLLYVTLIVALVCLLMFRSTRDTTISLLLALAAVWGVYEALVAFSFLDYERETYSDENND